MERLTQTDGPVLLEASGQLLERKVQRRDFLRFAGAGAAGIALMAAGCKKDNNPDVISLGEGDVKVLNFAYALEQLEAAFYIKVAETSNNGLSTAEASMLADIRDHEIAHREFFKTVLTGLGMQIKDLDLDLSTINFTSRDSILSTAKTFEDLGVSAYNGAGQLLENPNYLLLAGKIVSVEARHAAIIRDLISNGSFADSSAIDAQGLDLVRTPQEVLALAQPFIKTQIVL